VKRSPDSLSGFPKRMDTKAKKGTAAGGRSRNCGTGQRSGFFFFIVCSCPQRFSGCRSATTSSRQERKWKRRETKGNQGKLQYSSTWTISTWERTCLALSFRFGIRFLSPPSPLTLTVPLSFPSNPYSNYLFPFLFPSLLILPSFPILSSVNPFQVRSSQPISEV
jgi:hypothetical protein